MVNQVELERVRTLETRNVQESVRKAALARWGITYLRKRLSSPELNEGVIPAHLRPATDPAHWYPDRPLDRHMTIRELIANYPDELTLNPEGPDGYDLPKGELRDLAAAVHAIFDYEYFADEVAALCMELSLCPIHRCDWVACFDDGDPECEQIRAVFPYSHDT